MKPYYEQSGITIYHGDCREVLPFVGRFDLCLTDPPYGIGKDGQKPSTGKHGGRKAHDFKGWDVAPPDAAIFTHIFEVSAHQIIWGGNYFSRSLPPSMGWLVWDKGQRINQSDGELAYTSFETALRIFTHNRVEIASDGASHPTQKPLKLMLACLAYARRSVSITSVLDPFMGSGTTLVAAKQLGLTAVGIEREEKYCEIAALRLSQEVMDFGGAA